MRALADSVGVTPTRDFDASFAFGISLILNGIEATVSEN